jgi:hypothetical protein
MMFVAIVLGFTAFVAGAAGECASVLTQSLAQYTTPTGYAESNVRGDWPSPLGPFKMLAPGGSCKANDGALYGYFPKGKILGYDTGFTWYAELPRPLASATMQYDVYFDAGFDWKKGGKLPGLCGFDCPVGCSTVNRERGWSTRLMWRSGGRMTTYAYYPDKPAAIRCGEDWWWSRTVQSGVWHTVRLHVKINTPGKPDGVSRAWLDGRLVLDKTDVVYRYKDTMDHAVTRAYITTYAGGSSVADFAPSRDQYIKFRNFAVWEGDCDRPGGTPVPPAPVQGPGKGSPVQYRVTAKYYGGFCAELLLACSAGYVLKPSTTAGVRPWGLDAAYRGRWKAGFCAEDSAAGVTWTVVCD